MTPRARRCRRDAARATPPAAPAEPVTRQPATTARSRRAASGPCRTPAGWSSPGKEFADHLLSARFVVLLIVLGLAAADPAVLRRGHDPQPRPRHGDRRLVDLPVPVHARPEGRRRPGPAAERVVDFVGDRRAAARHRRSRSTRSTASAPTGTLPRLLSQPIYRDDVINGKFAAGLAVIGARPDVRSSRLIAAFGIIRLGIVPSAERAPADRALADRDVHLRLALAGVRHAPVGRRPAGGDVGPRSAFGTWLLLTIFGGLITALIGGFLAPLTGTAEQQASNTVAPADDHPAPARHALPRGVAGAAQPAGRRRSRRRRRSAGIAQAAAADPVAPVARPELHPRLAAGRDAGRADRRPASRSPTSASCARRCAPSLIAATAANGPGLSASRAGPAAPAASATSSASEPARAGPGALPARRARPDDALAASTASSRRRRSTG